MREISSRIRGRILQGDLPSGAPLRESRIAEELGASRGSVREALRELVPLRLVRYDPNRGFSVPRPEPGEVADLLAVRRTLELGSLRQLATGDAREGMSRLERVQEELEACPEGAPPELVVDLEMAFHATLVGLLRIPRLDRLFADLSSEMRIHALGSEGLRLPVDRIRRDHDDLIRALSGGSRKKARRTLQRHLRAVERALTGASRGAPLAGAGA